MSFYIKAPARQCFVSHLSPSRHPHIRQELKCLRDNSSQIRNPRSQNTSSTGKVFSPTYFNSGNPIQGLRSVTFVFTTCHLNHHSSIARLVDLQNLVWVQDEHRAHACFELHLMSKKNMYIHLSCVINFMSFKDGLSYIPMLLFWGSVVFSSSLQTKKTVTTSLHKPSLWKKNPSIVPAGHERLLSSSVAETKERLGMTGNFSTLTAIRSPLRKSVGSGMTHLWNPKRCEYVTNLLRKIM